MTRLIWFYKKNQIGMLGNSFCYVLRFSFYFWFLFKFLFVCFFWKKKKNILKINLKKKKNYFFNCKNKF